MSAYPFASSAKVNATLDALETSNIATTQQTLLQQILVAVAVAGGSSGTAPVNTSLPVISGIATEGETLTSTEGAWTGTETISFTYQWARYESAVFVENIAGATNSTYALTANDVSYEVGVFVTGTNLYGSSQVLSALTPIVLSEEVAGFFNRLMTPPTPGSAEELRWITFIDGLVADGVYQQMDAMTLWFAGANEGDCHVNLIQNDYPSARLQHSGAAVFTLGQGYSGGGPNRCITSNFNPSTATGRKFMRDADGYTGGSFGLWVYSTPTISQPAVDDGLDTGTAMTSNGRMILWPKYSGTLGEHNCLGTAAEGFPNAVNSSGFYIVQRTGANAGALYRNDVLLDSTALGTIAIPNSIIWYRVEHSCRMAFIGASLDAGQRTALYNRLTTLITAISGGVP